MQKLARLNDRPREEVQYLLSLIDKSYLAGRQFPGRSNVVKGFREESDSRFWGSVALGLGYRVNEFDLLTQRTGKQDQVV